jgi:hypothetical protein
MSDFNLSVITSFVSHEGVGYRVAEAMQCEMIQWKEAGSYPAVEDVASAIKDGMLSVEGMGKDDLPSKVSLKQYASGMIKWAKAGAFPNTPSLRAFMKPIPGAKSTRGRKAKGGMEAPVATEATEGSAKATEGSAKAAEPAALWRGLAPLLAAAINGHGDLGLPLAADEKAKVNEAARVILAFITAKAK